MWENSSLKTVDNFSRLFIVWAYAWALLALWGRIEFVARYAKRAREAADMSIDMHRRSLTPHQ